MKRVLEVWSDEPYLSTYYRNMPAALAADAGNLTDMHAQRRRLTEELGCKDFEWYLKRTVPDFPRPDTCEYHGRLRNQAVGKCIKFHGTNALNVPVRTEPCASAKEDMYHWLTARGELTGVLMCADISTLDNAIRQRDW